MIGGSKVTADDTLTVATWNTEWRERNSRDGNLICDRLKGTAPEIICLTEAHIGLLDDWAGFIAEGGIDWGGPTHGTRRKVLLWSRNPWIALDTVGAPDLPPGRFVKGVTETALGSLTVVGIVIPYHMSNVRAGRRDRKMWDDHGQYLKALHGIIRALPPSSIAGRFQSAYPKRMGAAAIP